MRRALAYSNKGTERLHGYHGRVLLINVTARSWRSQEIRPEVYRSVIGGGGLACLLLAALEQAQLDPFSPEAALVISFSPLVGSPLTTSAKFAVACRSPLTGYLNDSLASSRFAISGKQTGYDAIIVQGQSDEPLVLLIDEHNVEFHDASGIWGLECSSADRQLKAEFGQDYSFALIGPAGEQQVRFATVSHDGRHAGRGGSGAVLRSQTGQGDRSSWST